MPVIDRATGRVVALVVLLLVGAAALRGYLPGGERAPREHTTSNPAALVAVIALLGLSLAVVAFAVAARIRNRSAAAPSATGRLEWFRGGVGRPTLRVWLILLGLIVGYLVIAWLLARAVGPPGLDQPLQGPQPSTPTPVSGTAPPARQPPPESGGSPLGYLYASTVIFFLLLVAGAVVAARRTRRVARPYPVAPDRVDRPAPAEPAESLARAAELGLAEIGDLSREPREAIIACYAAMERELTNVPGAVPQDFDTPTEVLARAVEHHALHADNAAQLVDLFEEARFSPHVMNEAHRDVAVRVLRLVLEELRSVA